MRGTPGSTFPSSAISENPAGGGPDPPVPVCDPTIEGTCIRSPALTRRTRTLPLYYLINGVAFDKTHAAVNEVVERRVIHCRRVTSCRASAAMRKGIGVELQSRRRGSGGASTRRRSD